MKRKQKERGARGGGERSRGGGGGGRKGGGTHPVEPRHVVAQCQGAGARPHHHREQHESQLQRHIPASSRETLDS